MLPTHSGRGRRCRAGGTRAELPTPPLPPFPILHLHLNPWKTTRAHPNPPPVPPYPMPDCPHRLLSPPRLPQHPFPFPPPFPKPCSPCLALKDLPGLLPLFLPTPTPWRCSRDPVAASPLSLLPPRGVPPRQASHASHWCAPVARGGRGPCPPGRPGDLRDPLPGPAGSVSRCCTQRPALIPPDKPFP